LRKPFDVWIQVITGTIGVVLVLFVLGLLILSGSRSFDVSLLTGIVGAALVVAAVGWWLQRRK
jgi:hypothetical protein